MRGIWVDMEAVNCSGAEETDHEASLIGTTAWVKEFQGVYGLAQVFHASRPRVEFAFGPYNG